MRVYALVVDLQSHSELECETRSTRLQRFINDNVTIDVHGSESANEIVEATACDMFFCRLSEIFDRPIGHLYSDYLI